MAKTSGDSKEKGTEAQDARAAAKPRRVRRAEYKSFGLQKKIKRQDAEPLPGVISLTKRSVVTLRAGWRQFLIIMLMYVALCVLLVQGLSMSSTDGTAQTTANSAIESVATATYVNAGSGTDVGGIYQGIFLVIISLVLLYGLREAYSKVAFTVRQAFYNSTYPLIPFLLVLFVIFVQLIPLALGGTAFSIALQNSIAASGVEILIWTIILLLLAVLSLYWLSSSLFALLLVTLPDMRPLQALKMAKQLVANRRAAIMRKLLFLPFLLFVVVSIVLTPFVILTPGILAWLLLGLTIVCMPFTYSYVYTLYRELM